MISTNLHKSSSAIHRVFVFSFIPVLQADLNEFMITLNCWNIRKSAEAPGGVLEKLFNVPAYFDKEIYERTICYTKINKLTIPHDPDEGLLFYINTLECLEKDDFPAWIHSKFLDRILRRINKQIWVFKYCRSFPLKLVYSSGIIHYSLF